MDPTNVSLLRRVRDPRDALSWQEFYGIYAPLVMRYARLRGLKRADAEDVAQSCMQTLVKLMPKFEYRRQRGGFKRLVWTIAHNRVVDLQRKRSPRQAVSGELTRLADPEDRSGQLWEKTWLREHLGYCLKNIETRFTQANIQAFKLYVLQDWSVERVCDKLDLTPNQVYLAKTRITRRLRKEMKRLIGHVA